MNKLKVLSLFSGIGAFEKALGNIGVDFELVNYCEIDKYAAKAYSIIHSVSEELNLGDVTKIDIESLADFDLLTHGSPCQSFSISGKQEGGDKGSGTRSSLMWNTVEIVKVKRPKYVIWENVKNVISKTHKHNFEQYIDELDKIGYNSYYQILNSKDYGTAQNRERLFVVSILGEHDEYIFPEKIELTKRLKDYLEDEVADNFYINKPFKLLDKKESKTNLNVIGKVDLNGHEYIKKIYDTEKCSPTLPTGSGGNHEPKILCVGNTHPSGRGMNGNVYDSEGLSPTLTTNKGEGHKVVITDRCVQVAETEGNYEQNNIVYSGEALCPTLAARDYKDAKRILELNNKDVVPCASRGRYNSEGKVVQNIEFRKDDVSNCLTTVQTDSLVSTVDGYRVRKLTPLEYWRLQAFEDSDFKKVKDSGISNSQLYKMAGNSITVSVLEAIFKELFK